MQTQETQVKKSLLCKNFITRSAWKTSGRGCKVCYGSTLKVLLVMGQTGTHAWLIVRQVRADNLPSQRKHPLS